MIPEKIGRYEIRAELGRGGMATVYHGYDPRFEREVAIKVLPSELLHSDPQFKLRFEREAKIIAQLEHPSIVPVYDVGDQDGQPYFVMRYMNGGSLSERIKARVMTIEEAANILGKIAPGLDEAHSKGIVHRDLKPSNILFDSKGIPYISDFGIAKLTQAQGSSMTGSGIIGTPAYMAPEQASGETVDGRSDIYALGIILFEMLTGKQPYEADTPMGVAIKHITEPVPHILTANPDLPADADTIIQTAMAKSRDDRFSTAVGMVESLREVGAGGKPDLSSRTVSGTSSKTALAGTRIAKKNARKGLNVWAVIIPIMLVLLLTVAGGGYVLFNGINLAVKTETPASPPTAIVQASATSKPVLRPTKTQVVIAVPTKVPTDTPVPPTDTPAAPKLPVLGGADKIALVANNELWLMNVDGSDLKQLTNDGASKSDLQWMSDGETILFISGKIVKYYNVKTNVVDTLASFASEVSLDAFQVSHDGKQVMIAMSNQIFVVPFGFDKLKNVTSRRDLLNMDACIVPTGKTPAALEVQEARWSADDKLVAWLFRGVSGNTAVQAEQVSIFDITACKPELIDLKDNFPGSRFVPVGYQNREIPDFDWNGYSLFAFNTSRRNNGWGEFYIYNWDTHKPTLIYPIKNSCCYRDIRWSPDGTYVAFAFQDIGLGAEAPNVLYYVPSGALETGADFKPIPLPDSFFKDPREAPQPAMRPAQS